MQIAERRAVPMLLVVALTVAMCSYTVAFAESNDPCPNEGHVSTGVGEDLGIPKGDKVCPRDGGLKQLYGGCESNPYEILETQFKSGSNVQLTPRTSNDAAEGGIDSALACRLSKFLEVAKQKGCNPKLISAYRSAQQQENMCGAGRSGCAPAGRSCHQYGLAVDVSASCIGWMRMAAPQFQLVFPYYGNHIQCAEHPGASVSSCNRPCNGGIRIEPDLSRLPRPDQVPDTYYVPPPPSAPPTSGLANQFRQALGMPQQPTIPTSNTPQASPTSDLPQPTQSNFCLPEYKCSGNTLMYQNAFCATQISQVCSAGCLNGACVAATSTASSTTNTNDNTNSSTSTIDILDRLSGYSATSSSIATATPLQLILALAQGKNALGSSTTSRPVAAFATGSIASAPLIGAQQTFTSSDLSGNAPSTFAPSDRSSMFAVLENMKNVLLRALEYLRPFQLSRSRAQQQEASYINE